MYPRHRVLACVACICLSLACVVSSQVNAGAQVSSINMGLPLADGTWNFVDNGWF
jgi:hypothetical protein